MPSQEEIFRIVTRKLRKAFPGKMYVERLREAVSNAVANTPDPILVECWPWPGATSRSGPVMQIRPHGVKNPAHFLYWIATRRICDHPLCVNPAHRIPSERPPTTPRHPSVAWAVEVFEELQPTSLKHALELAQDEVPPEVALQGYRDWYGQESWTNAAMKKFRS